MIFHTAQQKLKQKINWNLNWQKTPHSSPLRASYGVSVVRILENTDHVITALDYTRYRHPIACLWLRARSQIAKFMGPTWDQPGSCRPQLGPMLAPWTLLSGICLLWVSSQGSGSLRNFHVKIQVNIKDFQTWHLIVWLQSCQPIRSHVWKSWLTNMDLNMDFTQLYILL